MFYDLQSQPTFHSEERLVNLARGKECFVCLSILLFYVATPTMHDMACAFTENSEWRLRNNTLYIKLKCAELPKNTAE